MKNELSPKDISAITGINESKIETCIAHGFLSPKHFSASGAVVESPTGKKTTLQGRVCGDPKKVETVKKAREEMQPYTLEFEPVSAEERFKEFWATPGGKKRMLNPRFQSEVANVSRGAPFDWRGPSAFTMPENYDSVAWQKK